MGLFFYRKVSSPIVTDGLIFNLDAGNPTSYPGTGSIWYDLSGLNNHATLINSPTFNNSGSLSNFSSNNLSSYAELPDIPTRTNSENFTYESVFYFTNTDVASTIMQKRQPSSPYYQKGLSILADPTFGGAGKNLCFFLQSDAGMGYRQGAYNLTISGGARIVHAIFVNDSTSARLYVNGTLVLTDSTYMANATFNVVGYPTSVGNGMTIYLARQYNKTLTQQEVTQNFEATRTRFGL